MSVNVELWAYSFVAWPAHDRGFNTSVFDLFEHLKSRVEIVVTERGFEAYRDDLATFGITMREIERVPWSEPESVL